MSLGTEALLIGSYAAQLRGVLPAWRNGHVGDADFVCTRRAAAWIMGLFGTAVVEHAPGRCFRIDRAGGRHIDMDLRGHLLPSVMAHADVMQVLLNGWTIECLVARPALILALREASQDVVPKAVGKARLDIDGYRQAGVWTPPALAQAALAFRKDGE
ncbi:hypothetical protein PMI04_015095 [Sphingobium sp. AP49]|uniref:hypothetical protein n=1 Tax=Sphingobium sp. AP49 TaxID=1144307 RepID=UPI00026ED973|nr:hypothetical protein [Sphingobium sp. AP49]WHO37886.1 hypothetical protein PMI04_015095 [Sphingobium sp. AP49]